jgi:hypothetical protein
MIVPPFGEHVAAINASNAAGNSSHRHARKERLFRGMQKA